MKIAVGNDIHLDHVRLPQLFVEQLQEIAPDFVILTGDISTGDKLDAHLDLIEQRAPCPVYYVLGNHDFWNDSFKPRPRTAGYLTALPGPIRLNDTWSIVGQDGWYDFGYSPTGLKMVDYRLISEFRREPGKEVALSKALAAYHADRMAVKLTHIDTPKALAVTHVPPFREASRHNGLPAEYGALGTFSSKVIGEAILTTPVETLVLSGHSHDPADVQISDKVRCVVGAATYGAPKWEVYEL